MTRFQKGDLQAALRLSLCACAFFIFLGTFSRGLNAQTAPQPKTNAPVSQSFADYFTQVAAQNHVVIVAENIPFRLTITDDEKKALTLSVRNVSLQKNIAAQAAFFDYESQFSPPNRFVFRKKYTSSADLPYVSLDEAAHLLEAAERVIRRYKSPFKGGVYQDDPNVMEAARSFTQAQLDLMKMGKLPMTSLLPGQREQLQNVMTCFYIDNGILSSDTFGSSQNNLRIVRTETEGHFHRFGSRSESNFAIYAPFAFLYPTPQMRVKMGQVPLSFHKNHTNARGDSDISFKRDTEGNKIPFQDSSEPNENDIKAAETQTRALASPTITTFGSLAQRLTEQAAGKTVYVIEAELQTNPVSLFGAVERENGEAIFGACASAYDLRVVEEKGTEEVGTKGKRVLRLTRPIVNPPGRLQDLPRAVARLMPGPYVRALHLPEMNAAHVAADAVTARTKRAIADRELRRSQGANVPDPVVTKEERERRKAEREKNESAWNGWISAPDGMEQAALRRLRATAEPKAQAAPGGKAPLYALDDTEKNALTVALMYTALDSLQTFCLSHPPDGLARFDELMVYGKPFLHDDEIPCLEIQLGFQKPDGNLDVQMGFGAYLENPAPYWQKKIKQMNAEAARKKQAGQ